jgi:methyl-accepting chemotaxis protein
MRSLFRKGANESGLPSPAASPSPPAVETVAGLPGARATAIDVDFLEADLTRMIADVLDAVSTANRGIAKAGDSIGDIRARSGGLAALAEGAIRDAERLQQATASFSAASQDIGVQAKRADAIVDEAAMAAEAARANADGLRTSSAQIGPVIGLIGAVARQTNLLALNATIEAARAGEAGRGFAVVATEVKALSVETRNATEEIGRRVEALQADASRLIDAVGEIGERIREIRPLVAAVSKAVETQLAANAGFVAATQETHGFVDRVGESAREIEGATAEVGRASGEAGDSARHAAMLSEQLRQRFVQFLRESELGDRRRHDRILHEARVRLSAPGVSIGGRTLDISSGGALVALDARDGVEPGAKFHIEIGGVGRTVARVAGLSAMGVHLAFEDMEEAFRQALATRLTALSGNV